MKHSSSISAYAINGFSQLTIDLFACTFCFPNTNHVIILRRIGLLFCSLKRAHASMNVPACTLFNEQKKGPNLLSIST